MTAPWRILAKPLGGPGVKGGQLEDSLPLSGGVVHSNVSTRLQWRDCVLTGHKGS